MSELVPDGWELTNLNAISIKIGDGLHATPKYVDFSSYPFINGNNLVDGNIKIKENTRYVAEGEYLQFKKSLNENTILLSINGTIGKVAFYRGETVVLGKSAAYITLQQEICKGYIYYILLSNEINSYFELNLTGTTIKNLSLATIRSTPFAIPPLPEQQKIAKILSSVDTVIEQTRAQLDKLTDLKTAMMQELLTKGIGHNEFKDSVMGLVPSAWEVVSFSSIFQSYCYGPRFSSKDYNQDGNVKTIRGTDITRFGSIEYSKVPIASLDNKTVELHKLADGDLVMITTADCGNTAVFETQEYDYIASAYAVRLRPNIDINPYYVQYFTQTAFAKDQISRMERKGTVANLAGSDVMKIKIAIPNANEAEQIVKILKQNDRTIHFKQNKLTALKNTKAALMQDLLTGKVRVTPDATNQDPSQTNQQKQPLNGGAMN